MQPWSQEGGRGLDSFLQSSLLSLHTGSASFPSPVQVASQYALMDSNLECINDGLNVSLDSLVGEFRACQGTHALQGQVSQVGLPML